MLTGMTQLTRPAIGVLVDPERMAAARKSAMLERIELAHLSQALDLLKIAAEEGVPVQPELKLDSIADDVTRLRQQCADAGLPVKRRGARIGVSRDEIAKLETGGRKRPKITTMRKLIDTLNYARDQLGKPPLQIEDLQVPGEVLVPEARGPNWEDKLLTEKTLAEYQEASNDIYYAMKEHDETGG